MKEKGGKSLLQHYSLGLSSSAVFLYIEILYYTIGPKVQFFAPFRIFSELNNVSDFDPEMSSLYTVLIVVLAAAAVGNSKAAVVCRYVLLS